MKEDKDKLFNVRIVQDARAPGLTFGPFLDRSSAEDCVITLAGRNNILSAIIEESEDE